MLNRFQAAMLAVTVLAVANAGYPQRLVSPGLRDMSFPRLDAVHHPGPEEYLCREWFTSQVSDGPESDIELTCWGFQKIDRRGDFRLDLNYFEYNLMSEPGSDRLTCGRFLGGYDLFEPCRFSVISGVVFVRSLGEHWADSEKYLPLGHRQVWAGILRRNHQPLRRLQAHAPDNAAEPEPDHPAHGLINTARLIVSEPATLILLGASLLMIAAVFRFRRFGRH